MYFVLILMALGILLGYILRNQKKIIPYIDNVVRWSIYLLLFLLGISVGTNKIIIENIGKIGFHATVLTVGSIAGSLLISFFTYHLFFKKDDKK